MKARAKIPAVTNAIGTPCIPLGTSDNASCSRKPANITNANVKLSIIEPSVLPVKKSKNKKAKSKK